MYIKTSGKPPEPNGGYRTCHPVPVLTIWAANPELRSTLILSLRLIVEQIYQILLKEHPRFNFVKGAAQK